VQAPERTERAKVPALVERAIATAREQGFPLTREEAGTGSPSASVPATGRFLAVLAASCRGGRIAELGTGVGIGSAWPASAMPADCMLITAEIDPARAASAATVLSADERVQVRTGDWADVLPPLAPFDLIFADSGIRDPATFGALVSMLNFGGKIVMDDVTPVRRYRQIRPSATEIPSGPCLRPSLACSGPKSS
jgi:predicted O-methyltransferase YrrM